jgi:hypothetical protein
LTGQKVLFMSTSVNLSPCSSSCSIWYASIHAHDIINDAAQLVVHLLHDAWWQSCCKQSNGLCVNGRKYGVSIFISTLDRVCFISTGSNVSLIHVATNMIPNLRRDIMELSYFGRLMTWRLCWKRAHWYCWINFMILCRDLVCGGSLCSVYLFLWCPERILGSS